MAQLKSFFKKIILLIIMITIIINSCAVPNSYAKLTLQDGEFYYAGTTKGSYVPSDGIFSWLFDMLAQIATFLLTLIPNVLRMAFVGYAAAGEKILTWAVESTAGVNLQGEDINATDLSKLSDSTNNITVQAIVYNMVPALNVNFFDSIEKDDMYIKEIEEKNAEGEKITKKVVISPTGQQLNCKKCGKSVLECCGEIKDQKEIKCYGDCGCNNCEACTKYAQLMTATDPIIVQLKTLVAVWYYLIRLLAVAAMAVVLIAIGIKMAISTIASDKAVYKRMLVDWVIGIILIFTMHYIMYFAITINEILVNTVRASATAVNKVQLSELAETSENNKEVEKTNQDVEIDVYEEIRTRAYDMKMTVGLVGMIMYITMVFMAFKYTLIYVKRWLTLAVLTLMAPGIGVAYALQKVISGKSSSLKTWLTEYILNLIIQVVHALIYAIFISAALIYSLQNVSGVILALILMNFSLKAEGIFRRIFNLDPGNKGLLGSTETAGDKDKIMAKAKAIKGMALGGSPVAKALTFPTRAIVGGAGKTAAAGALIAGSGISKGISKGGNFLKSKASPLVNSGKKKASDKLESMKNGEGVSGKIYSAGQKISKPVTMAGKFIRRHSKKLTQKDEDKELRRTGQEQLQQNLDAAKNKYKANPDNKENAIDVLEANRRLERYREITARDANDLTVGGVVVGHVKGAFDIDNYFDIKLSSNGKKKYKLKPGVIFGTRKYNPETGKFEKDTSNAAYTQLGAGKLLGFTDKDKKIFKEQIMSPALRGVGGMAAMFMGMGTFVGHPVVGMGLLAGGLSQTGGMVKKFHRPKQGAGRLKMIHGYRVKGSKIPFRFKFGSFSTPTIANMRDEIVMQANRDLAQYLTKDIENRHPGFSERMRNGMFSPKTLVPLGAGFAIGTISLPAGIITAGYMRKKMSPNKQKPVQDPMNGSYKNAYDPYGYEEDRTKVRLHPVGTSALDIVDKHHFEQYKKQKDEIDNETSELMGQTIINQNKIKQSNHMRNIDKKIDNLSDEELENMQVAIMAALGFSYDPKTGTKTAINDDIDVEKKNLKNKVEVTDENGKKSEREITDNDVKNINKALNEAILSRVTERAKKGEIFDVNSEKELTDIIKEVSAQSGIKELLGKDQSIAVLFKGEMSAIKSTIKDKAQSANNFAKAEMSKNLQLNGEEFDIVKESIIEIAQESATKDGNVDMTKLDQDKIFAKVQSKMQVSSDVAEKKDKNSSKKKSNSGKDSTSTKIDQVLTKSKEIAYKNAINTLLTDNTTKTVGSDNMKINLKSKNALDKMDNILNLQTGIDPLQIKDRIKTEGVTSKKVTFEKKQTRDQVKKSTKKQVLDLLEAYASTTIVNDISDNADNQPQPAGKKVSFEEKKKEIPKMTIKQKLDQAISAIDTIMPETKETKSVRDTMIQSLLDMATMQQEMVAANEYAEATFSETTKGKRKQNYLHAIQNLSEARKEEHEVKLTELREGKVDETRKKKSKLALLKAENKLAEVGPVQDTTRAATDIVSEMKKKIQL